MTMSEKSVIAYRYAPREGASQREINREKRHAFRKLLRGLHEGKSSIEVPSELHPSVFTGNNLKAKAHREAKWA
jgi:hypothetical protein